MKFSCQDADFDYIQSAPYHYQSSAEIPTSAERVFEIFEDEHAWPLWFSNVKRIEWTSAKPFGVGTTRTVFLKNGFSANEYFYAWEPGRKFGFYFTDTNIPSLKRFAELYELTPIDKNRCRFTLHVGLEPIWPLKLADSITRNSFAKIFNPAPNALAEYVQKT